MTTVLARMVCDRCGHRFAGGQPWCPACTSERAHLEGTDQMGKTTVQTGSTVTDLNGVTRAVNDDGSTGDPIHDVVELPDGRTVEANSEAANDVVQVSEGTGEPMVGIAHPADGTMSPPVSNEPAKATTRRGK